MKKIRVLMIGFMDVLCLLALIGCSHALSGQAANELHLQLRGISEIVISYDEELVTFFQTDSDELIIKEYMTKDKNRYRAKVKRNSGSIHVSEGGKPFFKGSFSRNIEVYLPEEYEGNLTVTTTDGNIDISRVALKLSSLNIDSTAGTVYLDSADASVIHLSSTRGTLDLGSITGGQIDLETTSGVIYCEELTGAVNYISKSGDLDVKSAVGFGNYKANNSGRLQINYVEVTGGLSIFNKNGEINLKLPKDLEFEFEAVSKNASVSTSFEENTSIDGRTVRGTIGSAPAVMVKTETVNGNIVVTQ